MFRHLAIGTNDPEAARQFYDATFAALGIAAATADSKGRLLYRHDGALLIVGRPIDGQPATYANGGTIGFSAPSEEAVLGWHSAGLANGGTECEGQPIKRVSPATGREVTVAYLRDPAGNKICAVYDAPE
ncbi:VOC family protein [Croceibacterium sp. LX-88]|jgi:catechol 2,3-dioxygenase-like lactoylglutathione lyase family enzyme|uniref:VOC family protein n=1 Tax=Croceibacterium selenioxidans TaxID=2838833 RepID=A0ABS5W584_9SPHN|nr:VOC family protein [Croceibacterium selenioxidans]MBT2134913.1 VOC family protein [Croceibacterium selenioxidans]